MNQSELPPHQRNYLSRPSPQRSKGDVIGALIAVLFVGYLLVFIVGFWIVGLFS